MAVCTCSRQQQWYWGPIKQTQFKKTQNYFGKSFILIDQNAQLKTSSEPTPRWAEILHNLDF